MLVNKRECIITMCLEFHKLSEVLGWGDEGIMEVCLCLGALLKSPVGNRERLFSLTPDRGILFGLLFE